jgi:hypothetical protein
MVRAEAETHINGDRNPVSNVRIIEDMLAPSTWPGPGGSAIPLRDPLSDASAAVTRLTAELAETKARAKELEEANALLTKALNAAEDRCRQLEDALRRRSNCRRRGEPRRCHAEIS